MTLCRSLVVMLFLAVAGHAQSAPIVEVKQGLLQGEVTESGVAFRGIPFARPPLGDLRWRPPVPAEAWPGIFVADHSGPPCLQADVGWNRQDAEQSREDCLTLDVSTPALHAKSKLPVMVWIHGGANWAGSGSGYSLSPIIRHNVVLVTLHYRLGIFGFLSHPALSAESPFHSSGNYGLLDQIAALAWVRDNIKAFGGDPANVTIFGESAGGQDVGLLRISPLARGLFRRAIEESGTAGFGLPPRSLSANEVLGETFQRQAGASSIGELRSMAGVDLLHAQASLSPAQLADRSFLWLQAIVDGWVVPTAPDAAPPAPTPLLIGSNARELGLFGSFDQVLASLFGDKAVEVRSLYERLSTPRLGDPATQLADDLTFRCPCLAVAARDAPAGVWQYHFDVTPPDGTVVHAGELATLFGDDNPMQRYWTNFAKTGNPNGPGLPFWPAFDREGRAYLEFTDRGPQRKRDLRGPICRLLPAL